MSYHYDGMHTILFELEYIMELPAPDVFLKGFSETV